MYDGPCDRSLGLRLHLLVLAPHSFLPCNSWTCALLSPRVAPSKFGDDACPFRILARQCEVTGQWLIEKLTTERSCTTTANLGAKRNEGYIPSKVVEYVAGGLVVDAVSSAMGNRTTDAASTVLRGKFGDGNVSVAVARRTVQSVAKDDTKPFNIVRFVAFGNAFSNADPSNHFEYETESFGEDTHLQRAIFVLGSGIKALDAGVVSHIMSLDLTHLVARTTEATVATHFGLDEVSRPGRPQKFSVDQGRMAVLVGRTYDHHRILLALGFVPTEDEKNVTWFLLQAKRYIPHLRARVDGTGSQGQGLARPRSNDDEEIDGAASVSEVAVPEQAESKNDGAGFMVFSDYGHALRAAVSKVLPGAHNPCCVIHFERNICTRPFFKSLDATEKEQVIAQFKRAYQAPTEALCKEALDNLERVSKAAREYVRRRNKNLWCASHMPMPPLGNLTSNDAESVYGQHHKKKRTVGLFELVQDILINEAGHLFHLRQALLKAEGILSPKLQKVVERRRENMGDSIMEVGFTRTDTRKATIVSRSEAPMSSVHKVNLTSLEDRKAWCTCGVSFVQSVPCVHVLYTHDRLELGLEDLFPLSVVKVSAKELWEKVSLETPATVGLNPSPVVKALKPPHWFEVKDMELDPEVDVESDSGSDVDGAAGASAQWHRRPDGQRKPSRGEMARQALKRRANAAATEAATKKAKRKMKATKQKAAADALANHREHLASIDPRELQALKLIAARKSGTRF